MQTVIVGSIAEVSLFAESVSAFNQPMQAVDVVLDWTNDTIRLVDNLDECNATDLADPCFTCPGSALAGTPGSYNWVTSSFPNDQALDRLNADCGPDAFCSPFTASPFNDGQAFYEAIKQIFCNGSPAPPPVAPPPSSGSFLVTKFRFEGLAPGVAQVQMLDGAPCASRQKVCLRGDPPLGGPCSVDSDCGSRVCIGGSNAGFPCSADSQCPLGICPPLCSACGVEFCCDGLDNCATCSFAKTRVISAMGFTGDVTGPLGPAAIINVSNCQMPTVTVAGPRYLDIVPAPGTDPVAIRVTGTGPRVTCSKYVQADATLGDFPLAKTPAEWASTMTDAFNDPADPTIRARGFELIADNTYVVQADCSPSAPGTNLSDPSPEVRTWLFGDVDNDGDRSILDAVRILDGFQGVFHTIPCTGDSDCMFVGPFFTCDLDVGRCIWITRENVDLASLSSCLPDRDIAIVDVLLSLEAFQGLPDSCAIICP